MLSEEKIKSVLNEKVTILRDRIIEAMTESPNAIYLVGGYGRGEGAWYEDELGIHPYNDFDLAIITETPLPHDKTEILRKELAMNVGIKWVDIDYYSVKALTSMTPTIHNVDLLEGGTLIYGEDIIKQNAISLDKQYIGKLDVITLYRTRMWTFLGSWKGEFHQLSIDEARFFKNQMAKAVLAACDMRLIKLHKYTTSYRRRAKLVIEEFVSDTNMIELVEWAINEKMRPSNSEMMQTEMESLYFRVKSLFVDSFAYALGDDAKYFLNPEMTMKYYFYHTKVYLFHIYSLLRYHKSTIKRAQDVFYAMNYVFHANNFGRINPIYLKKTSSFLMKHKYINQPNNSWDELRLLTASARNDCS